MTIRKISSIIIWLEYPGVAQLVACMVRDHEAVGSNPATRTKTGHPLWGVPRFASEFDLAPRPPAAKRHFNPRPHSAGRSPAVGSNPAVRTRIRTESKRAGSCSRGFRRGMIRFAQFRRRGLPSPPDRPMRKSAFPHKFCPTASRREAAFFLWKRLAKRRIHFYNTEKRSRYFTLSWNQASAVTPTVYDF